jgi:8-oxo-dGTP pyrophosphatase MutT (NUDIX family)
MHPSMTFRAHLRGALLPAPPRGSTDPPPDRDGRPAAVLIPLTQADEPEPAVLFTKRADDLPRHPGEISFPGGLQHTEDADLLETALRETEEELGLSRSDIEVLGALESFLTYTTGFWVTPFVGALGPDHRLVPSPAEIAEVFEAPLSRLDRIEREVEWRREGWTWTGFVYEVDGQTIWGATGRMLHQLLEIVRKEAPWPMLG